MLRPGTNSTRTYQSERREVHSPKTQDNPTLEMDGVKHHVEIDSSVEMVDSRIQKHLAPSVGAWKDLEPLSGEPEATPFLAPLGLWRDGMFVTCEILAKDAQGSTKDNHP